MNKQTEQCGCSGQKESLAEKICICLGSLFFLAGNFFEFTPVFKLAVFLLAWLLIGGKVILKALTGIRYGKIFNEYFLMCLATAGAIAIKEYPEAVAVMLFYRIGEFFQELAVRRSEKSISALMDLRPDFANLKCGDGFVRVGPCEVKPGDFIAVKPGEKIPLDGVVAEGSSLLDTSALTGESIPVIAEPGNEVFSGSINKNGLLLIKVTNEFSNSTVSRIFALINNAKNRKAPIENFITRFARLYTPVVVFAAIIIAVLPPLLLPGAEFLHWIKRALVFLVVSCPCALVLSIPLSFFGGIGGASRHGILVKGANYLSALNDVETVVFDKTGTLTRGKFTVNEIHCVNGIDRDELLFYTAAAEYNSNHPVAQSIVEFYGKEISSVDIKYSEEISGKGVKACVNGKTVLAGNSGFLSDNGIELSVTENSETVVNVALDGVYIGFLAVSDELKPDSKRTITELRKAGVRNIVMLSGDKQVVSEKMAVELGLDAVYAGLLPHQKAERLEYLRDRTMSGKKIAFVGDGINDAPALALSDIGIAMGGPGSDAAMEAADIVLMTNEPLRLADALKIAGKTRHIVMQNIILALAIKAVILVLGAMGIATMWEAVFGDVGVTLIAVCNAMRAMRYNNLK